MSTKTIRKDDLLNQEIKSEVYVASDMIKLLFRIKNVQLRMITDRGYNVMHDETIYSNVKDFEEAYHKKAYENGTTFRQSLSAMYSKVESNSSDIMGTAANTVLERTYVHYPETPEKPAKIGIDEIRQLMSYLKAVGLPDYIVIISEAPLSPPTIGEIAKYPIQHFLYEDMTYIPPDHVLVPRHEALDEIQKAKLLAQPNLRNIEVYPGISKYDVIAKWYNFQVGQIIKIYRSNFGFETAVNDTISYRVVRDIPTEKSIGKEKTKTSGKSKTKTDKVKTTPIGKK